MPISWYRGGVDCLLSPPLEKKSVYEKIHITQKCKRFHEGEPGVICADIGHNISRIIITIHVHKLDNALCLGLPSAILVKNMRTALEFTGRHDSQIDNR